MARTATKASTTKATSYEVGALHHVPPGELLLQRNIRDSKPSPDLVASVQVVGVLQPVTAVLTDDGGLLVRFGHRRVLAAVEAGQATVPVYVAGSDDLAREAEVARIVGQRDENTLRDDLTAAEDLGSFEQLVAFGLSADQIVSEARVDRAVVDRALAVSGSKVARAATAKYESLTLDQAAVVAEFEHDKDLVKDLVVTAVENPEGFAHVAQQARDEVALQNARQELLHELAQAGVVVIDQPGWDEKKIRDLDRLEDDKGKRLTASKHAECPGHAAYLRLSWVWIDDDGTILVNNTADRSKHRRVERYVATHVCRDFKKHGHVDRYAASSNSSRPKAAEMSEEERERARAERRLVIDNNKAWDSAQVVRREWLSEFAKRKTPPKGSAAFIAGALAQDRHTIGQDGASATSGNGSDLCSEWGLATTKANYCTRVTVPANTTENRALVIALVQVLASHEAALDRMDWRRNGKDSGAGRYLRFLQSCDYGLSDVEKFALNSKTV